MHYSCEEIQSDTIKPIKYFESKTKFIKYISKHISVFQCGGHFKGWILLSFLEEEEDLLF